MRTSVTMADKTSRQTRLLSRCLLVLRLFLTRLNADADTWQRCGHKMLPWAASFPPTPRRRSFGSLR